MRKMSIDTGIMILTELNYCLNALIDTVQPQVCHLEVLCEQRRACLSEL